MVAKAAKMEKRTHDRRAVTRKEARGKRKKGGKRKGSACWTCGKAGHTAAWCRKGGKQNVYPTDEEDSEHVEEATDCEEDLEAWCLLEESENEQWHEVISKREKQTCEESKSGVTVERGKQ